MKYQIPYGHENYPGIVHCINLTNGIEFLLHEFWSQLTVVRIQSTKMEDPKQWESQIMDLDYDFLLHLALGYKVFVYDFTRRGRSGKSRAIWQGIPWIKYVLSRLWLKEELVFDHGMHQHFAKEYYYFKRPTKAKIKYFRKFLQTDEIKLEGIGGLTSHDGDYCRFNKILDNWLKGNLGPY